MEGPLAEPPLTPHPHFFHDAPGSGVVGLLRPRVLTGKLQVTNQGSGLFHGKGGCQMLRLPEPFHEGVHVRALGCHPLRDLGLPPVLKHARQVFGFGGTDSEAGE